VTWLSFLLLRFLYFLGILRGDATIIHFIEKLIKSFIVWFINFKPDHEGDIIFEEINAKCLFESLYTVKKVNDFPVPSRDGSLTKLSQNSKHIFPKSQ
jgi:hypothetical protein